MELIYLTPRPLISTKTRINYFFFKYRWAESSWFKLNMTILMMYRTTIPKQKQMYTGGIFRFSA